MSMITHITPGPLQGVRKQHGQTQQPKSRTLLSSEEARHRGIKVLAQGYIVNKEKEGGVKQKPLALESPPSPPPWDPLRCQEGQGQGNHFLCLCLPHPTPLLCDILFMFLPALALFSSLCSCASISASSPQALNSRTCPD